MGAPAWVGKKAGQGDALVLLPAVCPVAERVGTRVQGEERVASSRTAAAACGGCGSKWHRIVWAVQFLCKARLLGCVVSMAMHEPCGMVDFHLAAPM